MNVEIDLGRLREAIVNMRDVVLHVALKEIYALDTALKKITEGSFESSELSRMVVDEWIRQRRKSKRREMFLRRYRRRGERMKKNHVH